MHFLQENRLILDRMTTFEDDVKFRFGETGETEEG